MIDWTVNLGNLIGLAVVVLGGARFVYSLRSKVDELGKDIIAMQEQLRRMVDVLIEQGRHAERLSAIDSRINSLVARIDELTNRFNRVRNGHAD